MEILEDTEAGKRLQFLDTNFFPLRALCFHGDLCPARMAS